MNIEEYNPTYLGSKDNMRMIEDKMLKGVCIYRYDELLGVEAFQHLKVMRFMDIATKEIVLPQIEILDFKYFEGSLEIFVHLLKQQPKLRKLYITASVYGKNAVETIKIFNLIKEFNNFFDSFKNIENIILVREESLFTEAIELTPLKDDSKPYITGYRNSIYYANAKVKEHTFLKDLNTLKRLELPKSRDQAFLFKMLETNLSIESLSSLWNLLDSKYLSKVYKDFGIDEKYKKNYNKLVEDLKEIEDNKKESLIRLFLVNVEPSFQPKAETLLAFLKCSVASVRQEALKCFDRYYSKNIETLRGFNIWLSGSLQIYKNTQVKEMLLEKGTSLSSKETKKTDLFVMGLKPKIEKIPNNLSIITILSFEKMLGRNEERILVQSDNKDLSKKLKSLLESNDKSNRKVAFSLMEEGGIPKKLRTCVLAIFTQSIKKERTTIKKIIERHGGALEENFFSIMGRKNRIDKKMLSQLEALDGFDMDIFKYIRNEEDYFTDKNNVLAKVMILKHFNKETSWINSEPSKHFLEAKNIKNFTISKTNSTLWAMNWLENLCLSDNYKTIDFIIIPKEIEDLNNLKSLEVYAEKINIAASLSVKNLEIVGCKDIKVKSETMFHNLETVKFKSCSLDFIRSVKVFLNKKSVPKLMKVLFFSNYGSERNFPLEIITYLKDEFANITIELENYEYKIRN
jgi:hypothetical protein